MMTTLLQVTADQPIKVHRGWDASWLLWIILGFVVLVVIASLTSRRGPGLRV
jgi:hypothetical protein